MVAEGVGYRPFRRLAKPRGSRSRGRERLSVTAGRERREERAPPTARRGNPRSASAAGASSRGDWPPGASKLAGCGELPVLHTVRGEVRAWNAPN